MRALERVRMFARLSVRALQVALLAEWMRAEAVAWDEPPRACIS